MRINHLDNVEYKGMLKTIMGEVIMTKIIASYILGFFGAGVIIVSTFAFVVVVKSIQIMKAEEKEKNEKLLRIERLKKLGFKK